MEMEAKPLKRRGLRIALPMQVNYIAAGEYYGYYSLPFVLAACLRWRVPPDA
jgi:hypothetical protein